MFPVRPCFAILGSMRTSRTSRTSRTFLHTMSPESDPILAALEFLCNARWEAFQPHRSKAVQVYRKLHRFVESESKPLSQNNHALPLAPISSNHFGFSESVSNHHVPLVPSSSTRVSPLPPNRSEFPPSSSQASPNHFDPPHDPLRPRPNPSSVKCNELLLDLEKSKPQITQYLSQKSSVAVGKNAWPRQDSRLVDLQMGIQRCSRICLMSSQSYPGCRNLFVVGLKWDETEAELQVGFSDIEKLKLEVPQTF